MSVASSRSRLEGSVPPILPSVFDETNIMANTAVRHKIQQQQQRKKEKRKKEQTKKKKKKKEEKEEEEEEEIDGRHRTSQICFCFPV